MSGVAVAALAGRPYIMASRELHGLVDWVRVISGEVRSAKSRQSQLETSFLPVPAPARWAEGWVNFFFFVLPYGIWGKGQTGDGTASHIIQRVPALQGYRHASICGLP
jgi:hypothetical protein